jgi:hypothetical protein
MACKEVKDRKYQTRKSPPFHAGDCRGATKRGGDGAQWVSRPDGRGVYKWVKAVGAGATRKAAAALKGKAYEIHDNGGRPFRAFVQPKRVQVMKLNWNEETEKSEDGPIVFDSPVKKVYIGEDHMRIGDFPMSAFSRGNSLLARLNATDYVYIGWKIQKFQPMKGDEIIGFESPIGNNDVPYSFAVGKEYTYLLIEEKVLPNSVLDIKKDPYMQYYDWKDDTPDVKKAAKALRMKTLVKRVF